MVSCYDGLGENKLTTGVCPFTPSPESCGALWEAFLSGSQKLFFGGVSLSNLQDVSQSFTLELLNSAEHLFLSLYCCWPFDTQAAYGQTQRICTTPCRIHERSRSSVQMAAPCASWTDVEQVHVAIRMLGQSLCRHHQIRRLLMISHPENLSLKRQTFTLCSCVKHLEERASGNKGTRKHSNFRLLGLSPCC